MNLTKYSSTGKKRLINIDYTKPWRNLKMIFLKCNLTCRDQKAYIGVWGQMWRKGTWQRQGWLLRVIGISCLNCGSGVLSVCVCQSSLNFILNWYSLSYRDHSSMKLISETLIGRKEYRIWQNNQLHYKNTKQLPWKGQGKKYWFK